MMSKRRYWMSRFLTLPIWMIGLLCLAGCSDELSEQDSAEETKYLLSLSGSIEQNCESRASDLGFADRDRIGVYMVNYKGNQPGTLLNQGNHVNNMRFILNKDKWVPTREVYWVDKTTRADVYGYYPFTEGEPNVNSYEFTVAYDQNEPAAGRNLSGYEASDFLWAKTMQAEPQKKVNLRFRHVMAGVKVILQEGTGFAAGEYDNATKLVAVENVIRKSTVNFASGKVTPNGAFDKNIIMAEETGGYRAVVVPQTIDANMALISVTLNGKTFVHKLSTPITFVGGKLHHFTLTVNKKKNEDGDFELKLESTQITDWENDQLSHDFEANSYVTVHVEKEGELQKVLLATAKDPTLMKHLKVSGRLTTEDITYVRTQMLSLKALNIKEVKMVHCYLNDAEAGTQFSDDVLPEGAFEQHPRLERLILPDQLKAIGPSAVKNSALKTTLVIPEGVTRIYGSAFAGLQAPIILPHSLEHIDASAFYGAHFSGDLYLSDNIKYIGDYAFYDCQNITGHFHYPESLKYLGKNSFVGFGKDMTGELIIPQNITVIKEGTTGIRFKNGTKLKLHDGITKIEGAAFSGHNFITPIHLPDRLEFIGQGAFKYAKFRGELNLPKNLKYLGSDAFTLSGLNGKLEIPENLSVLSSSVEGLFNNSGMNELVIPNSLEQIGDRCFGNCAGLRFVTLGKGVAYIGDEAFRNLPNLSTFVCLAKEPPLVGRDVFTDVGHMAVLQVPEGSVERYKAAPEWKKFPYITAYHELAVNLREITTLNKGVTRDGMIRSEGKWYVKSCPDWVTISPMEGDEIERKTEVSIMVKPLSQGSGNRTGEVVFGLTGKDYTTKCEITQYDYKQPEDTEIELQVASEGGKEIPIFFVGEGFDAASIIDGSYERIMKKQMEHLFAIEPYKTYRNYFTVTFAIAASPEKGLRTGGYYNYTRFNSYDNWGAIETDVNKVKRYVMDVSKHIDASNLNKSLIVMIYNVNRFGGNTLRENDGTTISFCPLYKDGVYPYTQSSMIQREVGGVGFGKLGTEAISHYEFIKACICSGCNALGEFKQGKANGWLDNLSLTGKMNEVPWKHLIFDAKYASLVDIYEGGYNHARGVFRSESKSIMNSYLPYFNTISRESIVKRIMKYAGKPYDFETFKAKDKIELPTNQ